MNSKRKKSKGFTQIGSILEKSLESYHRTQGSEVSKIQNAWKDIVGATIAENAAPFSLKEKTLTVFVTGSIWVQHLQYSKSEIIGKINRSLESRAVLDIKFKVGNP